MSAAPRYRGRFAPSPTGPLHLGSLLAALGSWLDARQHQGEWLIRIEDLDPPRERPGAAHDQLSTLAAFGMESDRPVVYQSQRSDHYEAALDRLLVSGRCFACSCSRNQLAASQGIHHQCVAPIDPRHQALRLRVAPGLVEFVDRARGRLSEDCFRQVGDVVLKRADGLYAYQLAVVVDDAEQGVTDVVRGADLLDSTARQQLLQRALDLPTPNYLHLPLVRDADGAKLSKSLRSLPITAVEPLPALNRVWSLLGQPPELISGIRAIAPWLRAAVQHFDVKRLPLESPLSSR